MTSLQTIKNTRKLYIKDRKNYKVLFQNKLKYIKKNTKYEKQDNSKL